MHQTRLYTIGFTRKSAERFFSLMTGAGVQRVVDIRLKPGSQLAGFAKGSDLAFFLKAIGKIDYVHLPELAPSKEIMDAFKKGKRDWQRYENDFNALLRSRGIPDDLERSLFDHACLLCSEDRPDQCHRRLVAEFLADRWEGITIHHLF